MNQLLDCTLAPADVVPSKITYRQRTLQGGATASAKMFFVQYNNTAAYSKNLVIQTPWLRAPFGLSTPVAAQGTGGPGFGQTQGVDKYSLSLSVDPAVEADAEFLQKLREIDDKVLDDALAKKFHDGNVRIDSKEVCVSLYTSSVKTKDNHQPLFKVNAQLEKLGNDTAEQHAAIAAGAERRWTFKTYMVDCTRGGTPKVICGTNGEPKEFDPLEVVGPSSEVMALVHLKMVYVTGSKTFGTSWRLAQLLVKQRPPQPSIRFLGVGFLLPDPAAAEVPNLSDDSGAIGEEEADNKAVGEEEEEEEEEENDDDDEEEEEDDEEEEEDESEPEPEPMPKPMPEPEPEPEPVPVPATKATSAPAKRLKTK